MVPEFTSQQLTSQQYSMLHIQWPICMCLSIKWKFYVSTKAFLSGHLLWYNQRVCDLSGTVNITYSGIDSPPPQLAIINKALKNEPYSNLQSLIRCRLNGHQWDWLKTLTSDWIHWITACSRESSSRQRRQLNQLHHGRSARPTDAGSSTAAATCRATCTISTAARAEVCRPCRVR